MDPRDDIRERIIGAASLLFARYGYGKTSMADIARDCDMSPGNLYRFFENKLDIASQIVRNSFDRTLQEQRKILDKANLGAGQCLTEYVLAEMEGTYHQLEEYPTLLEQAQEVRVKRPLLVHEYLAGSRALIAEILGKGVASGEFDIDDIGQAAATIQAATLRFRYPQLHTGLSLDDLTREVQGVLAIMLDGLKPGQAAPPAA